MSVFRQTLGYTFWYGVLVASLVAARRSRPQSAETYDPNMLGAWGARGVASDIARARELYRKAHSLGVASVHGRLEALK
jgi:hypothetical protein